MSALPLKRNVHLDNWQRNRSLKKRVRAQPVYTLSVVVTLLHKLYACLGNRAPHNLAGTQRVAADRNPREVVQQPTFKPVHFRESRKPPTARHHHAVWSSRMRVCRLDQPSMGHMGGRRPAPIW